MNKITLNIMGVGSDFKVFVYSDDKNFKEYIHPDFDNIPVYAGQKIEFFYHEGRSWKYDDRNHKTHFLGVGTTYTIVVPESAQGTATLFIDDKYSDWFLTLHGGLGWIDSALISN